MLLRDEVRDLAFLFEGWGEDQISVFCKEGGSSAVSPERALSFLGALSPYTLARSEVASIFLRLKGDSPRGKGALC